MRVPMIRLAVPVLMAAAALVASACSDLTGVDKLNGRQPTVRDSIRPTITIDSAGLTQLRQGDSITVTATDNEGVRRLQLLFVQGDTTVVWRSQEVAGDGEDSLRVRVPVTNLGTTFPFGEELRVVGFVEDVNGGARYGGATGDDTLSLAKATGRTVRVGAGDVLILPTGTTFDDLSYDPANQRLFFVSTAASSAGSIDLRTFQRTNARMEPGSRPTKLLYRPRGLGGTADLLIFDAGSRRLRLFPLDIASQGATRELLSLELGQICLDMMEAPPAATALAGCLESPTFIALPDTGLGRLAEICGPMGCETWIGRTARNGAPRGIWQRLQLNRADSRFPFNVVTPLQILPTGGVSNVLADRDPATPLRASPVDMRTGDVQTIWERTGLSSCGTFMDSSYVMAHGTLSNGTSVVYVKPAAGSGCDFSVVRQNGTGSTWEIDRPSQVQIVGDTRWETAPKRLVLTADGRRLVAEYSNRVYVATTELDILADIRTETITAGGLLREGVGDIQANRWYVVANGRDISVWDLETYQKVGTLRAAAALDGDLWVFPTGKTGELAVVGRSSDRKSIVKVVATVRQIRGR